jgi:hypothetical protein
MILSVRYFFEKNIEDYQKYTTEWDENKNRMIFLNIELSNNNQIDNLIYNIKNNQDKDILAIRFPNKEINNNDILKRLLNGEGITYNNNCIWYPNEIWIYK